jgi:hypothetical protein
VSLNHLCRHEPGTLITKKTYDVQSSIGTLLKNAGAESYATLAWYK